MDSGRLALSVTLPDGTVKRWGGDEPNAGDIPRDLALGDSIPGGHKDLTTALFRDAGLANPDFGDFYDVRAYLPGNRTAWRGRITQSPRDRNEVKSIQPGAEGYSSHLKDDSSFAEIYADAALDWKDSSSTRRLALSALGYAIFGASSEEDEAGGLPGLRFTLDGPFSGPVISEVMSPAQVPIAEVYYDRTSQSNRGSQPNASFIFELFAADNDSLTGAILQGDQHTSIADGEAGYWVLPSPKKVIGAHWFIDGLGGDGDQFETTLRKVTRYGAHGLTRHGDAPGGFYGHDIVADVVGRAAPLLNFTVGTSGSIEDATDFIVPHLSFPTRTTAEEAILALNRFFLYDWGVYDRTFFWRNPANPPRIWEARLDQATGLDEEGPQAAESYNGVLVHFTDFSGRELTAGPLGSGCDVEDAGLMDTRPENPVNQAGIPRRWKPYTLQFPTNKMASVRIGDRLLDDILLRRNRRGSVTFTGRVRDSNGHFDEAVMVRSGEGVRITDSEEPALVRRIIEKRYTDNDRKAVASLDTTPDTTEALLERMGLVTEAAAVT